MTKKKNLLLRKLRKNKIKTLKQMQTNNVSQTSVTFRKHSMLQQHHLVKLILTAGSNETFVSQIQIQIISLQLLLGNAIGGSGCADGDVINLD